MREATVQANGIRFSYLEEGEGPLVLLLHGFPDNAHTWDRVAPHLVSSGYRVVAPFMRGYAPTEVPADGWYDTATLATDARELIAALGDGEPAFVIGHDWGAATTYMLCGAYPGSVRRAVALALPHPMAIAASFTDAAIVHRVFHFWFFQMEGLPESILPVNDFAFIDYLWKLWSEPLDDPEHLARVKATLGQPGTLSAALGYYRAMLNPAKQDPALAEARTALTGKITVPTMTVLGSLDITGARGGGSEAFFDAEYRLEEVPGAGHFLQREDPDLIAKLAIDWFARA